MNLPLSRFIFMLSKEIGDIFKYEPGMDVSVMPPCRIVTDEELSVGGVELVF